MSACDWLEAVKGSPKISRESRNRLEEIQFYSEYAEPGYDDPGSGIIALGNWNNAQKKAEPPKYWVDADDYVERVAYVLEKRYGAELEWCDEWCGCSECSKLIRTSPNSYQWSPSYYSGDGEILCPECSQKNADTILSEYEGNERKALTRDLGIDPSKHGYMKILDKLENGLHEHMASDPKVIAKELKKLGVGRFLFMIDEQSQFYITFSCWVHEDEFQTGYASGVRQFSDIKTDADVSPAEYCKRALREASINSAALTAEQKENGGVIYTKVNVGDGTAETRLVPPDEFIKGVK